MALNNRQLSDSGSPQRSQLDEETRKQQEPRDAQLAGLKERGMPSDEEFESKKRELLAAHPSR